MLSCGERDSKTVSRNHTKLSRRWVAQRGVNCVGRRLRFAGLWLGVSVPHSSHLRVDVRIRFEQKLEPVVRRRVRCEVQRGRPMRSGSV